MSITCIDGILLYIVCIYIYMDFIGSYLIKSYTNPSYPHLKGRLFSHGKIFQDSSNEKAEAVETDETEEFAMEEDEKNLETAPTGGDESVEAEEKLMQEDRRLVGDFFLGISVFFLLGGKRWGDSPVSY